MLLAQIFAAEVAAAELRGSADSSLLYPAEATVCAGFALKRISDFTAGRLCARRALADLGITGFPIVINPDRTPRWPPGIIGSISHTNGYCCAVAAREPALRSIGVDAEIVGRVTRDLDTLVFTQSESAFLSSLAGIDRARAATIIFSAKEAFYKCQFAITQQWLEFGDARLELHTSDMLGGTFVVLADDATLALGRTTSAPLRGRFRVDGNLVLTGIVLRHETDPAPSEPGRSAKAAPARSRSKR